MIITFSTFALSSSLEFILEFSDIRGFTYDNSYHGNAGTVSNVYIWMINLSWLGSRLWSVGARIRWVVTMQFPLTLAHAFCSVRAVGSLVFHSLHHSETFRMRVFSLLIVCKKDIDTIVPDDQALARCAAPREDLDTGASQNTSWSLAWATGSSASSSWWTGLLISISPSPRSADSRS